MNKRHSQIGSIDFTIDRKYDIFSAFRDAKTSGAEMQA